MLRLLSIGVVLLALCGAGCGRLSGGDSPQEQAARKIRDAEALSEARDYQRAADTFEEALRLDPNNEDAHFKVAVIYDKKLDQFLPAIYHYEIFLKLEPDPEKNKLASDFLNNAQFQYVATLPQFKKMANPDVTKLQTDSEALRRQISDLKAELIRVRTGSSVPQAAPPPVAVIKPKEKKPVVQPNLTVPATLSAKTYKVKKGDGLQSIAQKFYGDKAKWHLILEANPQIKSAADLRVGQVLKIP